jgi:thiosulfate/3-mercaptopyruvate sulfurtransferase
MPAASFTSPARRAARALVAAPLAVAALAATSFDDPRDEIVVTSTWLAERLDDPRTVILHVGDPRGYASAHIPGARHVTLEDVSAPMGDHSAPDHVMLELPHPDSLRERLAALGISDDSRVVVYFADDWVSAATRVVLSLYYAGLGDRTSLLDGGLRGWSAEGRPVTRDVPAPRRGTLSPRPPVKATVGADWVLARLGTPGYRVVDARAAVFYDGVEEGGPRRGHIRTAASLPFTEVADERLRLRSPGELARLFERAGVQRGDTVIAYCHIGQQATLVVLAARTLGIPAVLYDGSFQEWSRRPELPVDDPSKGKR